jgi:hypothetical protein
MVVGDGASIAPVAGAVVVVVGGAVGAVVPLVAPLDGGVGALTANWLPVTTVTWAPFVT